MMKGKSRADHCAISIYDKDYNSLQTNNAKILSLVKALESAETEIENLQYSIDDLMDQKSALTDLDRTSNLIPQWVKRIITGTGGFLALEGHDDGDFYESREEAIAEFVIRCLANPCSDGSEQVLQEIIENRKAAARIVSYNFMRETLAKLDKSEITFGRMIELINQEINKQ
jgi:hypothetical protein